MNNWSRAEKIALLTLLAALVSAIGTILIVPEFRHTLRLSPFDTNTQSQSASPGRTLESALPTTFRGKIAFISDRKGRNTIYSINADGTGLREISDASSALNRDITGVHTMTISPDGKQIAFGTAAFPSGTSDIYTINADGSNLRNLTHQPALDLYPAWSPDGTRIAFISNRNGKGEVCIMRPDGTDFRVIGQAVITYPGFAPAWSPDGRCLAFLDQNSRVNIADLSSNELRNISQGPDLFATNPIWSPNSVQVGFQAEGDIYIMNADCSRLHNLTDDSSDENWYPSWSPDGKKIAFASKRDGGEHIYTIDLTDLKIRKLTDDSAPDIAPFWSPDGTEIVFHRGVKRNNYYFVDEEVWMMFADGSNQHNLTNSPAADRWPRWFPK